MYLDVCGQTVFAATGGKPCDREKPLLVFLHGSGLDHTFWALHTRFFAFRGYAVLAPDLPGHSLSAGAPLGSVEDMADWLHALLEAAGGSAVSLVGHSMGCLVALEYAARYPQRLCSLSCVASGLATPVNPALLEAAANEPDQAVAMMIAWGFGPAGHQHLGPVPGNAMRTGGQRVMRRNAPSALSADLHACNDYRNGKAAAAAVHCPSQVIVGGLDRMAPRKATDGLIAALDAPRVDRVADSGHMVPLEAPDACRSALREFIFQHNPAH